MTQMINDKVNTDVFTKILIYAGELRFLKIKMNKANIKYLFENDANISIYLTNKTMTYMTSTREAIYLQMLDKLENKNISNMEDICNQIIKTNIILKITLKYCLDVIEDIINDYNEFYLNDDYYYGGYWYNGYWFNGYLRNGERMY
jgi:hypothetical protein